MEHASSGRVYEGIAGADGKDIYANRGVLTVHVSWGKIRSQEDYFDTELLSTLLDRVADDVHAARAGQYAENEQRQ